MTSGQARFSPRSFWSLLAVAIGAAIFGLSVVRAHAQSVTHDEALTWEWLLRPPPLKGMLRSGDPNNHVLHTFLAYLSVHTFGLSALALRLPALLGSLLYLGSICWIGQLLVRDSLWRVLFVALLSTNPLILDFNAAARGYGLALGLSLLATAILLRWWLDDGPVADTTGTIVPAALCLALSSAANLSFLLANAALAGCFLALYWIDALRTFPRQARRKAWRDTGLFILTGLLTFLVLSAVFLYRTRRRFFYAGGKSWAELRDSLVGPTLQHGGFAWPVTSTSAMQPIFASLVGWFFTFAAAGGLLYGLCILTAICRQAHPRSFPRRHRAAAFLCAVNTLTLFLVALSHHLLGMNLPSERMGLYLIAFAFLTVFGLLLGWTEWTSRRPALACLALPFVALLGLLLVQSASQLNCRHFYLWRYDAGARAVFQAIARDVRSNDRFAGRKARVHAHWIYCPALRFHEAERGEEMLEIVEHGRPSSPADDPNDPGFDYEVFPEGSQESGVIRKSGIVLYQDSVSECAVARTIPRARASLDAARK
jgi:hypothetical protein